jgi:hypothetical protein
MLYGEDAAVFAGFTTATTTGNAGGREAMHALCNTAFSGSHMCHAAEYNLANSATPIPSGGAWIDGSATINYYFGNIGVLELASRDTGRYTGSDFSLNCNNWTVTTSGDNGEMLSAGGVAVHACSSSLVVACCSSPYKEQFAGFTSTTTTGALSGGRAAMHAFCGAQFSGSHLCHAAEYARASPKTTPPAGGAWLDASGYSRTAGLADISSVASIHDGRYTASDFSVNCNNWTAAPSGNNGETVTSAGTTYGACSTARVAACCR